MSTFQHNSAWHYAVKKTTKSRRKKYALAAMIMIRTAQDSCVLRSYRASCE